MIDPGMVRFACADRNHPNAWMKLVERYSKRQLSDRKDKLPAIAALAEEYGIKRSLKGYVAGLWRQDLLTQLLWQTGLGRKHRHESSCLAPSWSYASIHGPVFLSHTVKQSEVSRTCEG